MNKVLANITELLIDDFKLANKPACYVHFQYCCLIPTDQTERPRFETCIIHCSDDESLLISSKDLGFWKSLLKAASIRNHRPLLDLAENAKEGEIPHVSYHRKFRSLFTMKKDLESLSHTTAAASQIPEFNMESEEKRHRREAFESRKQHLESIFLR